MELASEKLGVPALMVHFGVHNYSVSFLILKRHDIHRRVFSIYDLQRPSKNFQGFSVRVLEIVFNAIALQS